MYFVEYNLFKLWFVLYIFTLFQVLKGDIRPAIETHEILYQVMQKHHFLPEVS